MTKGMNGITLDIYNADLNYEKLEFKLFLTQMNSGKITMSFQEEE